MWPASRQVAGHAAARKGSAAPTAITLRAERIASSVRGSVNSIPSRVTGNPDAQHSTNSPGVRVTQSGAGFSLPVIDPDGGEDFPSDDNSARTAFARPPPGSRL